MSKLHENGTITVSQGGESHGVNPADSFDSSLDRRSSKLAL